MPVSRINGVGLYWEQAGSAGDALVLVHGSWGDHANWGPVVEPLSRSFRVFTYDRRGHSRSERPTTPGSIDEDVEDLAALITILGLAPAHVAGNSFGAAITLRLAVARPDLFATMTVHEPPLLGMLHEHPMLPAVTAHIQAVVEALRAGDDERGAQLFVETVALGPGWWNRLPAEVRRTFVFNAPTFLDESNEPESLTAPYLGRLSQFPHPALVTKSDQSPPFFPAIVDRIAAALPQALRHTFRGGGHIPHATNPEEYVSVVTAFLGSRAGP